MKVGIIGFGVVGQALYTLFPDAVVYDKEKPLSIEWFSAVTQKNEHRELTMKDINDSCDIAFVCVPTPLKDGKLDVSIVEEAVSKCECDTIVIRSTVMPGTCDRLAKEYDKSIVFWPEYLGETVNHPLVDEKSRKFVVIGGKTEGRRKLIDLLQTVYNANISIRQTDLKTAEVIKLSENRAIAFKVAQCQELYDACEQEGIDYYEVREAVYGDDPRFNKWFTSVYPDNRGFNSKCIPKDVYGWAYWAEKSPLTDAMLEYNETLIKPKDEHNA